MVLFSHNLHSAIFVLVLPLQNHVAAGEQVQQLLLPDILHLNDPSRDT